MQFAIQREALLNPLQRVVGVIERRQTLPVLANFLVRVEENGVSFSGTDLEVQMVAGLSIATQETGTTTIPARKLFDIVRALPDGENIMLKLSGDQVHMQAGRSRFTLSTLPADEFPTVDDIEVVGRVNLPEAALKKLMDRTAFAMANQDVRYYLNGMLLELDEHSLRCVATDGHRLALAETKVETGGTERRQIIIPRKGVSELAGLFEAREGDVELEFGTNHLRVKRGNVVFTTKLIDGRFPDYEAVLPIGADKQVELSRESLRMALQRASILSNEKYRGVKLEVRPGTLRIMAHNPEREEAVEELEADTHVEDLSVGFNVGYLMDALAVLPGEKVRLNLRDSQSSCLIQAVDDDSVRHVVMPLRL